MELVVVFKLIFIFLPSIEIVVDWPFHCLLNTPLAFPPLFPSPIFAPFGTNCGSNKKKKMRQQHCNFLAIFFIFCSSLIFEKHFVSSFECYKCETKVYNQIDNMKKDDCYTLKDTSPFEKCQPMSSKCTIMELTKMDNDPIDKYCNN